MHAVTCVECGGPATQHLPPPAAGELVRCPLGTPCSWHGRSGTVVDCGAMYRRDAW